MNASTKLLAVLSLAFLSGCAGLHRREARDAAQQVAAAEAAVGGARQGGAAACAGAEMKQAESDLKLAKTNLEKRSYGLASSLAKSACAGAQAASAKCEDARRRKAASKDKAKR